jgi:cytosine/adenosine deaminase-related metal-dependent hydrolase
MVDLLVRGGTVVTCDAQNSVVRGDVLVRAGRIVAVSRDAERAALKPARVIDARGCAVMPGIVQAHVHLCQVLFRGMADDMPLLEWLRKRIWPLEAAHDEKSARASAELGLLEMMRAGTTTILDMGTVHEHDAIFDACVRSGIRAIGGKTMMDTGDDIPARLREETRASLDESDRLRRDWSGREGRIGYAYAPRFILSCSEKLVRGAAERAKEHDALFHSHVAEHPSERAAVRAALGRDDIEVFRAWGASGSRTVLAHGVQLTDDEARGVAKDGTNIVHCPSANLKLGSGVARIAALDAMGVHLALGCDGAPCNNDLDPWQELRHAALLAKMVAGPTAMPAPRALRLATIDGARALGLDAEIGSIEIGKRADLVVVRIDREHEEPGGDVFSRLVYAAKSSDVTHVLVDGAHLVNAGAHTRFDEEKVVATARQESKKLVHRAHA